MYSVLSTLQVCIQAESFHTLPKIKDTHWCFLKEYIANFIKHINCVIKNPLSHYMSQQTRLKNKIYIIIITTI